MFSSSCSTYGAAGDDFHDETAPLNPVTPYGNPRFWSSATWRGWQMTISARPILRNATAYGASPRLRLDVVLNDLVASALTTGRVYIKSDGTPWRPIVHIRDIIAAILAVLEAPQDAIHNQTFNVGQTEENYRISELADIVAETVPGCRVEYAPGGGPDKRCYRVNCDKIQPHPAELPAAVECPQRGAGALRSVSRRGADAMSSARPLHPHQPYPAL